jgi:hypothetical protein
VELHGECTLQSVLAVLGPVLPQVVKLNKGMEAGGLGAALWQ